MRVIAGELGGRIFASPHGHRTHPMSDKMRGALFNMLGNLNGLEIFDPFAGSGALTFEAISRGAKHVTAIEIDRSAQRTILENITLLDVADRCTFVKANARAWLNTNPQATFDVMLLDPPYDRIPYEIIESMVRRLRPGGRLVLSWPGKQELLKLNGLTITSSKNYGDGSLHTYQAISR